MKTQDDETQDIWVQLKTPAGEFSHAPNWLAWHPAQLDHCLGQRALHLPPPLTDGEREELRGAHQRWHADEASLTALEQLGRPTARVIVTGQQPGLLTGPLLVLYKSMAAIELARRLKAAHPRLDFVPVFWVASEDHDFDEIRRVFWPGHSGQLARHPPAAAGRTPTRSSSRPACRAAACNRAAPGGSRQRPGAAPGPGNGRY
jgi:hypothetical protein